MTTSAAALPGVARCHTIHRPAFGVRVEGTIDRYNAAAIAAEIVARGADYVLALKDNHPTLHEEVRATFAQERRDAFALVPPGTHDYLKTVEKDHGRLEIRRHWTLHDPAILAHLDPRGAWAHLRAVGLVERQRRVGERVTVECHHYLLSAPLSARAFAAAVRSHWGIENRLHWVLDVAFGEDACRARAGHAARNLAVLRHLVLNLLRQDTTRQGSVATKRFTAALDDTYLTALLAGLAPHHPPATD
jgi:predicted transposase YbfD/YdcC